jgi:hypothetical protein
MEYRQIDETHPSFRQCYFRVGDRIKADSGNSNNGDNDGYYHGIVRSIGDPMLVTRFGIATSNISYQIMVDYSGDDAYIARYFFPTNINTENMLLPDTYVEIQTMHYETNPVVPTKQIFRFDAADFNLDIFLKENNLNNSSVFYKKNKSVFPPMKIDSDTHFTGTLEITSLSNDVIFIKQIKN